jgi:LmbE family N-acetylglucosaminyl deacetylase
MIGRAAVPLPEPFATRLGPPLARVVQAAVDYLCSSRGSPNARHDPPPLDAVDAALDAYAAEIAAARHERLTYGLRVDGVEHMFALGFVLKHQDFMDLSRCVHELAQSGSAPHSQS